ncbi:MAG: glycoside hydrolase family 88 protein [Chitinophagaceae bacterium]
MNIFNCKIKALGIFAFASVGHLSAQPATILPTLKKDTISILHNGANQAQTTTKKELLETSMQLLSAHNDSGSRMKWSYDLGVVLEGTAAMWKSSANGRYFEYIPSNIDPYIEKDGTIRTYKAADYNLDNIKNGRSLLLLYKVTLQKKYLDAATILWNQLKEQPRTASGGFWYKKIYPNQIWLDGLYMAEPFYTEYAALAHKDSAFDDIAHQFILVAENAKDTKTGLLYHGWDESKKEKWADPNTGLSPHFWAQAMGWYMMALVDVLDYFPQDHPKRKELLAILNDCAATVVKYQSKNDQLWNNILDQETSQGNYPEASASCMFVYVLAKGVRNQYLPSKYLRVAQNAFKSIQKRFIEIKDGKTTLNGTVSVSGLGGSKNHRDGSFGYYMSEKVVPNDLKGIGAYLLAVDEIEKSYTIKPLKNTVLLDNYFNNEWTKTPFGFEEPFHYAWHEEDNNGFSFFGNVWKNKGYRLATLKEAPTINNLKNASAFIIVDPDTEKETKHPNYMNEQHAQAITDWVKKGGKLLLLANDSGNCDLEHLNILTEKFGLKFNNDSKNRVQGRQFEQGAVNIPLGNAVFPNTKKIYLKEISTINILDKKKVNIILSNDGNTIMTVVKYGKGLVFAVGDPWVYNEYVDGRKLPPDFENFQAANDLVEWISKQ